MSNTAGRTSLLVRMPLDLAEAVRKAAKQEGSDVSKITRELLTGFAKEAGTLPEPTYRTVKREKIPA